MNSGGSSFDSPSSDSEPGRDTRNFDDPNIVVLTKFEDVSMSMGNLQAYSPNRRTSLPENMHRLEITVSPRGSSLPSSRGEFGGQSTRDERLMVHYKGFIAKRIMPLGKHFCLDTGSGREDPIVAEARNFPPVCVCTISRRRCLELMFCAAAPRHMRHQPFKSSSERTAAAVDRSIPTLSPSYLVLLSTTIRSPFGSSALSAFFASDLRRLLWYTKFE